MHEDILEAKRVIEIEMKALSHLNERLDDNFFKATELMLNCSGKIIVTGVGKSGLIGRKIASTLSSTGSPALYMHPTESSHGDLGVVTKNDLVLAISYSGESKELGDTLTYCARRGIKVIAMTGDLSSPLADSADVALDISVQEEACPLKLAPTSSSTTTLVLGDSLAMALLKRRGFEERDFAEFHPGGSLGRRLLTRVSDVMHVGEELPLVRSDTEVSEVIVVMTGFGRGAAAVVDPEGSLVGAITDGDIRRKVGKSSGQLTGTARELMSKQPKTVDSHELAQKALFLMEQFKVNLLFVVDSQAANPRAPVGVLHIQDLMQSKIR